MYFLPTTKFCGCIDLKWGGLFINCIGMCIFFIVGAVTLYYETLLPAVLFSMYMYTYSFHSILMECATVLTLILFWKIVSLFCSIYAVLIAIVFAFGVAGIVAVSELLTFCFAQIWICFTLLNQFYLLEKSSIDDSNGNFLDLCTICCRGVLPYICFFFF